MRQILILGGTRFFGRHLAQKLVARGDEVTLLSRGRVDDGLGDRVRRITADRTQPDELRAALGTRDWDLVFDQIAFTAAEARALGEILRGRTERLIFTSSQSVYGMGAGLAEEAFDPLRATYATAVSAQDDYAEAKRQTEIEYMKCAALRPVLARMPLVIGVDDYTQRLRWHVERVREGKPIFLPNPQARLGFIRSDFAGEVLAQLADSALVGPVNTACPGDIALEELLGWIGEAVGRPVVFADAPTDENHSPYGVPETWTMSLAKLESVGVRAPELRHWLPELITTLARA
ncbi:MAG: NAD-dependent epimerase/dehydratase family protein [Bdellovibrionaceae bacterium]|nr:NAD-dependent epimerase/dehydratase family protein [Pseudobdellovibrionaceae bacterium]